MAVQTSYPGVYVQEVPSGVRTIAGVSTSVALFIGRTKWGPVNIPVLCLNYTEFMRTFTDDTSQGDMARAVRLFFLNGGTQCYIMRVATISDSIPTNNANEAYLTIQDTTPADTLKITARYPGLIGNDINFEITHPNGSTSTFDLRMYRLAGGLETDVQTWTNLSMDPTDARFAPDYVDYQWAILSNFSGNTNRPDETSNPLFDGQDGIAPLMTDYDAAYEIIDKEVDLFNLMILAKDVDDVSLPLEDLWGEASIFCQKRRAFLLMDPLPTWISYQTATATGTTATGTAATGVNSLRQGGLVKDHSAVFFPRLLINEDGTTVQVGPSGAIAGLMARTDANRGVWKAPAGTEADLRGITGLEYRFSDRENGVLNPRGVNTIRIFPNGIVNWGARTMDGDDDFASEYKYIPIRRTALFIEESLYRGLKWVVFEPNDEPLWSQIRMNVGAFMHNLFRQGAFQGTKKKDAYFVKCDSETTTQNDINLGIVNIWVGFAPLKPAEFVVLYLQQMTGQIQV